MDVVPSTSASHASNKRSQGYESSGSTRRKKKRRNASLIGTAANAEPRKTLLDLPQELLTQIFGLSANDALPATCWYLYNALCANPKHNDLLTGPPLWLQKLFVQNTNPTISFAVQKCLRRRFFSAETFKLFLPDLKRNNALDKVSVPMRCIARDHTHVRELMLCAELFLNGVTLTTKSTNKALVQIAAHQSHVESDSLFWKMTKSVSFSRDHVLQAFRSAARRHSFESQNGTFHHLVARFGIDDTIGHELYDLALQTQDTQLIAVLQKHGVRPDMAALTKITNMMNA